MSFLKFNSNNVSSFRIPNPKSAESLQQYIGMAPLNPQVSNCFRPSKFFTDKYSSFRNWHSLISTQAQSEPGPPLTKVSSNSGKKEFDFVKKCNRYVKAWVSDFYEPILHVLLSQKTDTERWLAESERFFFVLQILVPFYTT